MLKTKWKPEADSGFEGHVTISVPLYRQRLRYLKECNLKFDDEGKVEIGSDTIDTMLVMLDIAEKHVEEVRLKHVESGVEAKSFEDLEAQPMFDGVLNQVANAVFSSGEMGND